MSGTWNFARTALVAAHKEVYAIKAREKKWSMTRTEIQEYAEEMSDRVRALCRHSLRCKNLNWFRTATQE